MKAAASPRVYMGRYENTAFPVQPSPLGEGGEQSEPDRVLAV